MTGTDEEAVAEAESDPADRESDTGLLIAGTMLGVGIGIVFALVTGDMQLGLSIGVALGVVIPSGIRGSRR